MNQKIHDKIVSIIGEEWYELVGKEFTKEYMNRLQMFLKEERSINTVYPPVSEVFTVFKDLQPKNINVVILGQDPYPNNKYYKMAFSNRKEEKLSPSLENIFKELVFEFGKRPENGDLSFWQNQGIFLLNTILTVRKDQPLSHKGKGWELFTSACLRALSQKYMHNVYMLWGAWAKSFEPYIMHKENNLILKAAHPSPLSARLWFGNNHFTLANEYLKEHKNVEIKWI